MINEGLARKSLARWRKIEPNLVRGVRIHSDRIESPVLQWLAGDWYYTLKSAYYRVFACGNQVERYFEVDHDKRYRFVVTNRPHPEALRHIIGTSRPDQIRYMPLSLLYQMAQAMFGKRTVYVSWEEEP